MPKVNRTYCCVFGCLNNNIQSPDLSFFSIPNNEKLRTRWLQLIQRMDLADGSYRCHRVCDAHFWPGEILMKATRKLLKRNVMPSLHLPESLEDDESGDGGEATEVMQEVKKEIEESVTVYEEDLLKTIEKRQRQDDTDPLVECKRIKVEQQEPTVNIGVTTRQPECSKFMITPEFIRIKPKGIIPDIKKTKAPKPKIIEDVSHPSTADALTVGVSRENEMFPVDFMKSVLNSQEEILMILKSQVLLENPDPGLLTFLRFVGAKLSRLQIDFRKELQDQIIDLLNEHSFLLPIVKIHI